MIYEKVFEKCQNQYEDIHTWMQAMKISFDTLRENNSVQTVKNGKILKRIARIEEKLNIVNVEEPIEKIEGD